VREFLLAPPFSLADGPDRDVVVSTKVRYVRNLEGSSFPSRSSREDSQAIRRRILDSISLLSGGEGCLILPIEEAKAAETEALVERSYIESEEADDVNGVFFRALALCGGGGDSYFINGSDHLRIGAHRQGLQVRAAFSRAKERELLLDDRLRFAASFDYGYLTARPEDCGCGLRLYASVFLPGIMAAGVFDRVTRDLLVSDVEPRTVSDYFVTLSARAPLGVDENIFVDRFDGVLRSLADGERKTRDRVITSDRLRLEDASYRAAAILRSARLLSAEEAVTLLGRLRAGVAYGIAPETTGDPYAPIDAAILLTSQGHMKVRAMEKNDRIADDLRCELVRELLPRYLI